MNLAILYIWAMTIGVTIITIDILTGGVLL